jgi:hypothetical protein
VVFPLLSHLSHTTWSTYWSHKFPDCERKGNERENQFHMPIILQSTPSISIEVVCPVCYALTENMLIERILCIVAKIGNSLISSLTILVDYVFIITQLHSRLRLRLELGRNMSRKEMSKISLFLLLLDMTSKNTSHFRSIFLYLDPLVRVWLHETCFADVLRLA